MHSTKKHIFSFVFLMTLGFALLAQIGGQGTYQFLNLVQLLSSPIECRKFHSLQMWLMLKTMMSANV